MHKKIIICAWLFIFYIKSHAQINLVQNYSFENYISCPTTAGSQVYFAAPWSGTNNSTDYFNSCAPPYFFSVPYQSSTSFQYARTGDAFAGLFMLNGYGGNYREYLQGQLSDTLVTSICYKITFFVNNSSYAKYAVNNFGVYLSTDTFTTIWNPAPYTPQVLGFNNEIINDTLNWVEISGIYIANGGEKFISIGNFFDDANTDTLDTGNGTYSGAYYFIDDVSVISIDSIPGGMPAYAGADTNVILGDSVFIGQQISNLNCNWYDSNGVLIANNTSGIYVNPTISTYYVVEQNLCSNITYDTVNVTVLPTSINELFKENNVRIYPNPNNGSFTISHHLSGENYNLEITDLMGKIVHRQLLETKNNATSINTHQLANGIYFVTISGTDASEKIVKKLVIQK